MVERELLEKYPSDPAERVRALRVLLEVYRRKVKPELKEMYRKGPNGRTYGPYYAAYFSGGSDQSRLIYLGKEGSECVEFVRWLEGQSKDEVIMLAEIAASALVGVMEAVERKSGEADIVLVIAAANPCYWDLLKSGEGEVERVVEELEEVLGKWRPGMAREIRRKAPRVAVAKVVEVRRKVVGWVETVDGEERNVQKQVRAPVYEIRFWAGSVVGSVVTGKLVVGEAAVGYPIPAKVSIGGEGKCLVSRKLVEERLEDVKEELREAVEVVEEAATASEDEDYEVKELVGELEEMIKEIAAIGVVEDLAKDLVSEGVDLEARREELVEEVKELVGELEEMIRDGQDELEEIVGDADVIIPFGDLAWTVADELHERFGVPVDEEGDAEGNAIVIVDWTDELAGEQLGFPSGEEDVRRVVEEYWNVRVIKVLDAMEVLEMIDS